MKPLSPEWARTAVEWRAERDDVDPLPPLKGDPWAEAERRDVPNRAAAHAVPREINDARAASAPEAGGANTRRFRLVAFNDIKPDEGAHYLIKEFFPRSGVVVVWGPPKCGKSFWIFDLLMHVALGWEYRGHRIMPGAVVYCALEGAQGFKLRIEAFRQAKLSEADPGAPPFYLMAASLNLVRDHARFVQDIRQQLRDTRPAAVCIDTLNRSLEGSESSDKDMAAYIRAADAIRDAFDCLVIIVHHCGHDGVRPRGHSSLMGALDVQIAVRRDAADNIVAELELAKDGEVGLQFFSRLKVVEIGRDQDGDVIKSCVIEAVDAHATASKRSKPAKLPKSALNALRALKAALAECGELPPAGDHIPVSVRVVTVEAWRERAYQMGISASEEPRAKQKAFKAGSETLIAASVAAIWEPYVWLAKPNA
jgi:hypothetical protein